MVGFGDREGGVLDWHVETAERDHFCAIGDMKIVERGFAERFGGGCSGGIALVGGLEG